MPAIDRTLLLAFLSEYLHLSRTELNVMRHWGEPVTGWKQRD
jgi:hypothetical protein